MNDQAQLYNNNYSEIVSRINSLQSQMTNDVEAIISAQNKMASYFFGDAGSVPIQKYEELEKALKELEQIIFNNSEVFVAVNREAINNYNITHGGA